MNIQIRGACMRFIIILKLCIYFIQTVDLFIQHQIILRHDYFSNIASILLHNCRPTTAAAQNLKYLGRISNKPILFRTSLNLFQSQKRYYNARQNFFDASKYT